MYTYGHTLSLHDALPIFLLDGVLRSQHQKWRWQRKRLIADGDLAFLHGFQQGALYLGGRTVDLVGQNEIGKNRAFPYRSEEHTSELQSLMRISYAVFCLKKKTTLNTVLIATITQS